MRYSHRPASVPPGLSASSQAGAGWNWSEQQPSGDSGIPALPLKLDLPEAELPPPRQTNPLPSPVQKLRSSPAASTRMEEEGVWGGGGTGKKKKKKEKRGKVARQQQRALPAASLTGGPGRAASRCRSLLLRRLLLKPAAGGSERRVSRWSRQAWRAGRGGPEPRRGLRLAVQPLRQCRGEGERRGGGRRHPGWRTWESGKGDPRSRAGCEGRHGTPPARAVGTSPLLR